MSPGALEVVLKEFLQLDLLVVGDVLTPLEQAPTGSARSRPASSGPPRREVWPLRRWISSTPMAAMPERSRWARPHSTTCFADLFLDETPVSLDVVENALELHPAGCGKGAVQATASLPHDAAGCSFLSAARPAGRCSRLRNAAVCRLPPRSGGPHQATEAAMPCPISTANRLAESFPHRSMTTRLPEPLIGRVESHSEPVLTHRFC